MAADPLIVTLLRPTGQIQMFVSYVDNEKALKHLKSSDLKNLSYSRLTALLAEKEGMVPVVSHQTTENSVTYTYLQR